MTGKILYTAGSTDRQSSGKAFYTGLSTAVDNAKTVCIRHVR